MLDDIAQDLFDKDYEFCSDKERKEVSDFISKYYA